MSSMASSAEMWDALERAESLAHGTARRIGARTPMDTAQEFHDEANAIDAQTGRVLPRHIPGEVCMFTPPARPTSLVEGFVWGVVGTAAALAVGWVLLAVFYGWGGLV